MKEDLFLQNFQKYPMQGGFSQDDSYHVCLIEIPTSPRFAQWELLLKVIYVFNIYLLSVDGIQGTEHRTFHVKLTYW